MRFALKGMALNSFGASSGVLKSRCRRSWATPKPVSPPETTYFGGGFSGFSSSSSSRSYVPTGLLVKSGVKSSSVNGIDGV